MQSTLELRQIFDSVDADGSGTLEVQEIVNLCQTLGVSLAPDAINQFFNALDSNHDGKISFEEFVAWYKLGTEIKPTDEIYRTHVSILKGFRHIRRRLLQPAQGAADQNQ